MQLLLQHNWLVSIVADEALRSRGPWRRRPKTLDLYKVAGISPGGELYSVALCGAIAS